MRASRNKLVKLSSVLLHATQSREAAKAHLGSLYNARCIARGRIPSVPLAALVSEPQEIRLHDFVSGDGNVSALELLALCLLARERSPRLLLELGTFDGNTTLQLAANVDEEATVVSVDLPPGASVPCGGDPFDAGCVDSPHRGRLRFQGTKYESRIRRVLGNTLELDLGAVCGARPDFIFVDAGHSEPCVRNDSRKSLAILAPGGLVLWHDYGQSWPAVYNYLNELAAEIPLVNIAGTSLVLHDSRS